MSSLVTINMTVELNMFEDTFYYEAKILGLASAKFSRKGSFMFGIDVISACHKIISHIICQPDT